MHCEEKLICFFCFFCQPPFSNIPNDVGNSVVLQHPFLDKDLCNDVRVPVDSVSP